MAGIGFVLKKLSNRDNLFGSVHAFMHALVASSGPWIFTVISLGIIIAIGDYFTTIGAVERFRSIIIYNFAFSLVITGPIYMICTRFLADEIHQQDLSLTIGMLFGASLIIGGIQLSLSIWFYWFYAEFSPSLAISSIINYMLIVIIWLEAVFLSAMKNYRVASFAFLFGILFAIVASSLLAEIAGTLGMIVGFNVGLAIIVAVMGSRILIEYPYKPIKLFEIVTFIPKYWTLVLSGFFYNLGSWGDKFVMWFSPQALEGKGDSPFYMFPYYDSAMFLAYLSIVPSLAIFVYQIETDFYQKYVKFFKDSLNNASLDKIYRNQRLLIDSFVRNSTVVFVIQASVALLLILAAPEIFSFLGITYSQMGMYRYGVVGSSFQIFFLFYTIILAYFDNRRAVLKCYILFFVLNVSLTYFTFYIGFDYYGLGYAFACIISYFYAAFQCVRNFNELPYTSFITNNSSISR